MSLAGLLCHQVTIVRPTTTIDRYNDAVKGDTGPSWSSVARVVQRGSTENHDGREARLTTWLLYLPPGVDIIATDRVLWNGLTFEVNGPPNRAPDRRVEHHVEADLTLVEG